MTSSSPRIHAQLNPDAECTWLTIADASARLQCSTKTIRRWISAGLVEARRFGPRLIRVSEESLNSMGRPLVWRAPEA